EEVEDGLDELAVVDGRRVLGVAADDDLEVAEVDAADDQTDGRHEDVGHERRDDLAERGAHDETDREIDDVTALDEIPELVEEGCHRRNSLSGMCRFPALGFREMPSRG